MKLQNEYSYSWKCIYLSLIESITSGIGIDFYSIGVFKLAFGVYSDYFVMLGLSNPLQNNWYRNLLHELFKKWIDILIFF